MEFDVTFSRVEGGVADVSAFADIVVEAALKIPRRRRAVHHNEGMA